MKVQLTRQKDHAVATWAGGSTTELCICPVTASCPERNFAFRVSSATVEMPESTFSDFSGFIRHIMPLEGDMELWHNEKFAAKLQAYEGHTFDGSWQTRSLGTCVDFNLIHTPNLHGSLRVVRHSENLPVTSGYTGIYARCNGLLVTTRDTTRDTSGDTAGDTAACSLEKGDFLLLESEASETLALRLEGSGEGVLAVVMTVHP